MNAHDLPTQVALLTQSIENLIEIVKKGDSDNERRIERLEQNNRYLVLAVMGGVIAQASVSCCCSTVCVDCWALTRDRPAKTATTAIMSTGKRWLLIGNLWIDHKMNV